MTDLLMVALIVVAVVFFLGLCIFVHELGHLIVALRCGLHVERFSIGFGKKLWGFSRNGVEYVISALPFGGYVALPQLDPTDEPMDSSGNPLPRPRPLHRILTAFSGPLSNILFGFLLACLVWAVGVYRPAPVDGYEVYSIEEGSPEYQAGLREGDWIVQLNNRPVPENWSDFGQEIALNPGMVSLTFERNGDRRTIEYKPAPNPMVENLAFPFFDVRIPVVANYVEPGMPAARSGIREGDRIHAVNGQPVAHSYDFIEKIWESEGDPLSLMIERDGEIFSIPDIVPEPTAVDGETRYRIGVQPGQPEIKVHITPWAQFMNVINLTRRTLSSLFSPQSLVQPKHLSGPLGIVHMQYLMIRYRGWTQGLFFVVFVCFSLALINLLPIPVLDGGHILFAAMEGVSGRRIPPRIASAIQMVFAVLLISFMIYVTYFDIRRGARSILPGESDGEADAPREQTQD